MNSSFEPAIASRPTPVEQSAVAQLVDDDDGLSMLAIVNAVIRFRWRILAASAAAGLMMAGLLAMADDRFTTNVSFVPTSSGSASLLGGLAAQFGVSIPVGAGEGQPPQFYADLIQSEPFLQQVISEPFPVVSGRDTVLRSFAALYEIDEETPEAVTAEAIETLNQEVLTIGSSRETGVVRVGITSEWASVSQELGRRILAQIDAFNVSMRRTQAEAESRFMRARVDSARVELRVAENQLQRFLQGNREFRSDPRLAFEHDRLEREMRMRQEVYTTISQAYEQARIESVRTTPAIAPVEPARSALRPDEKHIPLKAILATLFAGALAASVSVWVAIRRRTPEHPDAMEFAQLTAEVRDEARRLGRRLTGRRA